MAKARHIVTVTFEERAFWKSEMKNEISFDQNWRQDSSLN